MFADSHRFIKGPEMQAFTFLLLLSLVMLLSTIIVLLRKREAPGAIYLICLGIVCMIWLNGYIIEINTQTLREKFLGVQIQYFLGRPFVPVFWYAAALHFTTMKKRPSLKTLFAISIIPTITSILLWTNEGHQLMYRNIRLVSYGNISVIDKDWGIWYYVHMLYSYVLLGFGGFILLQAFRKFKGIFRKQSLLFLSIILIPVAANLIYNFKIIPGLPLDLTSLTYTVVAVIIGVSIQQHGLLDLIPAAHDKVVESMSNGIIVLDRFERIIEANPAAMKIFNRDDFIGESKDELFKGLKFKWDVDESKQAEIFEIESNKSVYEMVVTTVEKEKNLKCGQILTFYDITDRKNTEKQLNELNKAKDKLFTIIAHDLKNPFFGLIGLSEMLYEDYQDLDDEEKKGLLHEIHELSRSTHSMLENLLDWSRQQTGRTEFYPQVFNISFLINENVKIASQQAKIKSIKLVVNTPNEINIFADQNMIDTVLRNLISNAIKFTTDGGEIEVSSRISNGTVFVSIKDSGIGMSEEIQSKLFKLDSDVKSSGTAGEKGTGLGLLLCKEFVEKNKGKINVQSEKGKGSTFTFSLPIHK